MAVFIHLCPCLFKPIVRFFFLFLACNLNLCFWIFQFNTLTSQSKYAEYISSEWVTTFYIFGDDVCVLPLVSGLSKTNYPDKMYLLAKTGILSSNSLFLCNQIDLIFYCLVVPEQARYLPCVLDISLLVLHPFEFP